MTVLQEIKNLLTENNIDFQLLNHEPVYTSADAAKIRDTSMSIGAKALVLYADKKPILAVVPGDKKLDFRKFKNEFQVKDLRMATPEEVLDLTTLEIGAIPPIGRVMNLDSYYDSAFLKSNEVAFNAGSHTCSIKMKAADLIQIEGPKVASLT